jgi:aspartate/glutamate racemase
MSMTKKIAILHTTPVTVEPLKELALRKIAGCKVINFVDDSILPQLAENEGDIRTVEQRLIQYAKFAEEAGADVILNACSSVGEIVSKARKQISIPIIRIDEAMAEEAIRRGSKIGVAATLFTTLNPTLKLLKEKASEMNKTVEFQTELAKEAYERLMAGDKEGHDSVLSQILSQLVQQVDVVVLAQASMARVVSTLPVELQNKFLSSPESGMESVKRIAEGSRK